jgi:hypothetical protein
MEVLVPLMPLFGALPLAAAAVLIARMWFRHRETSGNLVQQMAEFEARLEALRQAQVELQERAEFTERVLSQLKDPHRLAP